MDNKYAIAWQVGWSDRPDEAPSHFVPATVPGAVQLDWAKAEGWGDHTYGENWRQYGWIEDKFWTYRAELRLPAMPAGERLIFVSHGIDYRFRIFLDGTELHRQEGMFTTVRLDITERCREGSRMEIVIDPAPKRADAPVSRSQADQSCKPAVSYGWDWHPRLIPLGIWDETYIELRPEAHIVSSDALYSLNETYDRADVQLKVDFNRLAEGDLVWTLSDPDGQAIIRHRCAVNGGSCSLDVSVDQPRLWWPHDQGAQPLYVSEVVFQAAGSSSQPVVHRQTIGFRSIKLVMHEGAWQEPSTFPKSRSHPPITLEVNGRRVFGKGTNWVNPNIFPGNITADDYRTLLELAKDANMNLLRVWGGGIVNKEAFFDYCDEMGLMVWQEFPLACNLYPDSPAYLKVLDQESRSIIVRLRKHASVVLWCGGNELFNSWSGMTDQSLPLRLLNMNCYQLDPATPFIMTSPLDGMGHGHYMFRYETGEDVFQAMRRASNTAYTEFGVPGPASVEALKSFIPPDELFPPKRGTSWESHHAFNALADNMWLMSDQLAYYFGAYETLEQVVAYGQWLQSEGYKCIYEESRRQKPKCAMALNWCYNEPWPAAANNSIVSWPARPKPAYYAVQSACRPVLASARIEKFDWKEGEWFAPELWVLNDSPDAVPAGRMEAYLIGGDGERRLILAWDYDALAANENRRGPSVGFRLPDLGAMEFTLALRVAGRPDWDSAYKLLFRHDETKSIVSQDMLNLN
ncbi:glycoside hydrolase family 2 protein [Cohnella sp. GCM10027633]|uniref:glycoside hydrolase family 2 protein n=1 Tax=unclassified Cohnella TaxID=2636738 RepID=UPI003627EC3C